MSIETFTAIYLAGLVFFGLAFGDRIIDVLAEVARDEETETLLQWD